MRENPNHSLWSVRNDQDLPGWGGGGITDGTTEGRLDGGGCEGEKGRNWVKRGGEIGGGINKRKEFENRLEASQGRKGEERDGGPQPRAKPQHH